MFKIEPQILHKASKVKLLITDIDGVMTEGGISYTSEGVELKTFNVKDGLGFKLLKEAQISSGIITGRKSAIVQKRAEELNITHIYQGIDDKWTVLSQIIQKENIQADEVAYIGDDWNDLSVFSRVGLSCCPADAHIELLNRADLVVSKNGGRGAVRELIDIILTAQNKYQTLLEKFIK